MTTSYPAAMYERMARAAENGLDLGTVTRPTGPDKPAARVPAPEPTYEPRNIPGLWRADKVTPGHQKAADQRAARREKLRRRTSIEHIVSLIRADPDMREVVNRADPEMRGVPEFTSLVVDLFHLFDWQVIHYRAGGKEGKERTQVLGDAGGPDITAARDGRLLLVELKRRSTYLEGPQKLWREHCPPDQYFLWRPSDVDEILSVLGGDSPTS